MGGEYEMEKIRKAIKKYCYTHENAECDKHTFLLDYNGDTQNAINLRLLESLIERHFDVKYRAGYLWTRELRV